MLGIARNSFGANPSLGSFVHPGVGVAVVGPAGTDALTPALSIAARRERAHEEERATPPRPPQVGESRVRRLRLQGRPPNTERTREVVEIARFTFSNEPECQRSAPLPTRGPPARPAGQVAVGAGPPLPYLIRRSGRRMTKGVRRCDRALGQYTSARRPASERIQTSSGSGAPRQGDDVVPTITLPRRPPRPSLG